MKSRITLWLSAIIYIFVASQSAMAYMPDSRQRWLDDEGFYLPEKYIDKTLDNGFRLLYYESRIFDTMGAITMNELHGYSLVKIADPKGRVFSGLALPGEKGILPIIGMLDSTMVAYNIDENFNFTTPPSNINGRWVMADRNFALGMSPESRWNQQHPGKTNVFLSNGDIMSTRPERTIVYNVEDVLEVSPAKTAGVTIAIGSQLIPQEVAGTWNDHRGAGRGHKKGRAFTGGYYCDAELHRTHAAQLSFNPKTGHAEVKFMPGKTTKNQHKMNMMKGSNYDPRDKAYINSLKAQLNADFPTNHRVAKIKSHAAAWLRESPERIWGTIKFDVLSKSSKALIVKLYSPNGQSSKISVWPSYDNYDNTLNSEMLYNLYQFLLERKHKSNVSSMAQLRWNKEEKIVEDIRRFLNGSKAVNDAWVESIAQKSWSELSKMKSEMDYTPLKNAFRREAADMTENDLDAAKAIFVNYPSSMILSDIDFANQTFEVAYMNENKIIFGTQPYEVKNGRVFINSANIKLTRVGESNELNELDEKYKANRNQIAILDKKYKSNYNLEKNYKEQIKYAQKIHGITEYAHVDSIYREVIAIQNDLLNYYNLRGELDKEAAVAMQVVKKVKGADKALKLVVKSYTLPYNPKGNTTQMLQRAVQNMRELPEYIDKAVAAGKADALASCKTAEEVINILGE